MNRGIGVVAAVVVAALSSACRTNDLSNGGARVATSQSAPVDSGWDPATCKSLGYIVGRGGGSFGGGWISNDRLIEYAMNDLRNQAAKRGANYIQHDTPTMGEAGSDGNSTTTTATVSGTAYLCTARMGSRPAPSGPVAAATPTAAPAPTRACTPGVTQQCFGPGGCQGAQFCEDDGSKFSKCDCGGGQ